MSRRPELFRHVNHFYIFTREVSFYRAPSATSVMGNPIEIHDAPDTRWKNKMRVDRVRPSFVIWPHLFRCSPIIALKIFSVAAHLTVTWQLNTPNQFVIAPFVHNRSRPLPAYNLAASVCLYPIFLEHIQLTRILVVARYEERLHTANTFPFPGFQRSCVKGGTFPPQQNEEPTSIPQHASSRPKWWWQRI